MQIAKFTLENGKNALEVEKNGLEIVKFGLENGENELEIAEFKVEIGEFAIENGKYALEIAEFTLEIAKYKSEFDTYWSSGSLPPIVGGLFFGDFSEKRKNLLMVSQELGEGAVKLNCWVLRINFSHPCPRQVDDCETVRLVSMSEENVIIPVRITKRLHWQAIKQMSPGQFTLKLCQEALRYAGIWPLPSLGETVRI